MFKQRPEKIESLIKVILRRNGLETPLMQKRLIDLWDEVAGVTAAKYTTNKYIRNQTLYIHLSSPALRSDLSMRKSDIIRNLNAKVGGQIICDIRFM